MTTRKRTSEPKPPVEATKAETSEEIVAETPEEVVPEAATGKEPKVEELKEDTTPNTLKEAQAPELIQDQIRSKLNSRNTDENTDLFNPGASTAVAKAKMEELAKEQGFQLTRGREIGARLMARSKANRS